MYTVDLSELIKQHRKRDLHFNLNLPTCLVIYSVCYFSRMTLDIQMPAIRDCYYNIVRGTRSWMGPKCCLRADCTIEDAHCPRSSINISPVADTARLLSCQGYTSQVRMQTCYDPFPSGLRAEFRSRQYCHWVGMLISLYKQARKQEYRK